MAKKGLFKKDEWRNSISHTIFQFPPAPRSGKQVVLIDDLTHSLKAIRYVVDICAQKSSRNKKS